MFSKYNHTSNTGSQPPDAELTYSYSISSKNVLTFGSSSEKKSRKQKTFKRNCTACEFKRMEIDRKKRDNQQLQKTIEKRLTSNEQKVKNLTSRIIKELEEKNSSLRERLKEVEHDRDRLDYTLRESDLSIVEREKIAQNRVEFLQERCDKALEYNSELTDKIERQEKEVRNLRWKIKDVEERNEHIKEQVRWKEADIENLERKLYQEQQNSDRLRITCQTRAEGIDYMHKSLDQVVAEKECYKHELESVKCGLMFANVKNKENEIAQLQRNLHSSVEECKEVKNEIGKLIENVKNLEHQIETEKQKNRNLESNNPSSRLQNQLHTLEVNYNLLQQEKRNLQIKLESPQMKGTYQAESTTEMTNMHQQNEKLRNKNKKLEAMLQEKADLALIHSATVQKKEEDILITKKKLEKAESEIKQLVSKLKDSEQRLHALQTIPVSEKQKLSEEKESLEKEKPAFQKKMDECFQRSSHEETLEAKLRKLKAENMSFREYISILQKEKDSSKAKVATDEHELKNKQEEIKRKQLEIRDLKARIQQEQKETKNLREELSKEREYSRERYEKTQDESRCLRENLNQLSAENRELQNANAGAINKKIFSETQQQLYSLRTETQQLEKRIAELTSENNQLLAHIKRASKEKDDTLTKKAEVEQLLMKENQSLQDNLAELREEKRQIQEENVTSTSKSDQQLKAMARKNRQLEEKVSQLSSENNQLHMDIAEMTKEKDNALTRLSKVAGAKLTHGNAAITDLSDTNRPTKIAEKFSELYDNQWTDAFEELDNTYNNEEDTIQDLLRILQDAYTYCVQIENNYETRIGQAVFTLLDESTKETRQINGADIPVQKALTDLRLSLGNASCMLIEEMFLARLPAILKKVDVSVSPKTKLYARQCASLCWRMRIRDPPVFVRFEFRKGATFNTDILRRYTKTGGYLDFIVWPALYLHENGPVLSKGVAQPKHSP